MEMAKDEKMLLIVAKIELGTIDVPQYSNVDFKLTNLIFSLLTLRKPRKSRC